MNRLKAYRLIFTLTLLLSASLLKAQENSSSAALPVNYRSINLGASLEAVKDALKSDSYFYYRGDDDVSMLNTPNNSSLEIRGTGFIKRAFFIFYEDKLYNITLELNQTQLDFYAIYQTLRNKYGEANDIDPQHAYWDDGSVLLSVEKGLFVKYIDTAIFNQRKADANNSRKDSPDLVLLEDFLKQF